MELSWQKITEEELCNLFYDKKLTDEQIADLYGVTKSKVTYKRNKLGISIKNQIYSKFMEKNSEIFEKLNSNSKERLLKQGNIEIVSRAITHFVFRNGPVEDIHANGQLSENDMKTLNKYMVNRIAGLLKTMAENNWLQLELLLHYYKDYGSGWDKVETDVDEIDNVFKDIQ